MNRKGTRIVYQNASQAMDFCGSGVDVVDSANSMDVGMEEFGVVEVGEGGGDGFRIR